MSRILMVVPPERFRDEELFEPRAVLRAAAHRVTLASTHKGRCTGAGGESVKADVLLDEVDPGNYDAVIFVGGSGARLLFRNPHALSIAREMHHQGKVVAAICLAPVILANAGVLLGRRATVAGTEANRLEDAGATYTGPGITVDGNVVTANAPGVSRQFGERVCELLAPVRLKKELVEA